MKSKKDYQCPYEDISCDQLDSLSLTLECGSCKECEHYGHGVRYSKGFQYLNLKTFIILFLLGLLFALLSSCSWNEPGSLRKINKNHGKVVHDLIPVISSLNSRDTVSYRYVLINPETNEYSQITIDLDYHYYSIGDTLP